MGCDVDFMRQRPLKAPASYPVAHDHCPSRVVNRDVFFGPREKEHHVRLLPPWGWTLPLILESVLVQGSATVTA